MAEPSDFEKIIELIHTTLADPTVYKYLFTVALDEHTPLRRIVWIPRDYETQPPAFMGARRDGGPHAGKMARALYREIWNVEAHVSAESFHALELLRERLLVVTHDLFGTDSQPRGGVWTTQDPGIAGVMYGGAEKCVMRFLWAFNVVVRSTTVTVKHVETTPAVAAAEGGEPTPDPPPFVMNEPP